MTVPAVLGEMPRRLWTIEEYEHLTETGVFRPDERVELIEGEIVSRMPAQLAPHIGALLIGHRALSDLFGRDYCVMNQSPIVLGTDSEPEPDLVVLAGPADQYFRRKAVPADIHLVVEASDSSLAYDRGRKASLYARHGIADYWIVNLVDNCVEIRRDPDPEIGYCTIHIAKPGDTIEPLATPGKSVAVSGLLPR